MEKRKQGYEEAVRKLDKINQMSETEVIDVAKNLLRTVSIDRKQIEDRYILTRKEFADFIMKTIMNPNYKATAREKENNKATILLKYMAYLKEEAKLDYNRRLLQMIK